MKKIINKTTMAVILALSMVLALLGGIFFANHNTVANAADPLVSVKLEAKESTADDADDVTAFTKGTEFYLKITVTPNIPDNLLDSISLKIAALDTSVDARDKSDKDKCGYITFTANTPTAPFIKSSNISKVSQYKDLNKIISASDGFDEGFLSVGLSRQNIGTLKSDVEVYFMVAAKINDDVPDNTDFEIGVMLIGESQFTYRPNKSTPSVAVLSTSPEFVVQPLKFSVKQPSHVCTLDKLEGGQGDTDLEEVYDSTKNTSFDPENDTLAITVTDLTRPLSILPTTTDENAKVNIKHTNGTEEVKVANGAIGKIAIPDDGEITIEVVAEDGVSKTTYNLIVTVVGGKLEKLGVTTDTKLTTVTKNGLKETFDSATLAYTVYVPNDQANKVTLNAEVSTGHSELTNVSLSTVGNCSAPASAVSKSDFDVTDIEDNDTLTIKVKADNKAGVTSEKDYVITFDVVDTDATLDTLTVVGSTTNRTFANSASRASEAKIDYYYMVTGETNASSTVTVAANSSVAEIALDSTTGASKTLTEGQHTATITAEAGNAVIYSFYLDNYVPLQLKSGVTPMFMYLDTSNNKFFRKTYYEMGWTHGVDDLELEKYVIGQVEHMTSVNAFLANFDDATKIKIKLYNAESELVYDCGTAKNSYTADDLDDFTKPVGTSWKLEFMSNGEVEDTVYLSILGDLDGNGVLNAADINELGFFVTKEATSMENFAKAEVALASYIVNGGTALVPGDVAQLAVYVAKTMDVKSAYYHVYDDDNDTTCNICPYERPAS